MLPFVYRCPDTGYRVLSYTAEEISDNNADDYLTTLCTMCQKIHLLNPMTCEVLIESDE